MTIWLWALRALFALLAGLCAAQFGYDFANIAADKSGMYGATLMIIGGTSCFVVLQSFINPEE